MAELAYAILAAVVDDQKAGVRGSIFDRLELAKDLQRLINQGQFARKVADNVHALRRHNRLSPLDQRDLAGWNQLIHDRLKQLSNRNYYKRYADAVNS